MPSNQSYRQHSRIRIGILWALRIFIAAIFIGAAALKLSSQPTMVEEFEQIGLGQWFRYFTASVELVGALALLVPRASIWGALLLLLVDAGAFVAQMGVLHRDWIHTVVIGIVLGLLIVLSRKPSR